MNKYLVLLQSRRFQIAVATLAVVFSEELFGYKFDVEVVASVVAIAASWIVGNSIRATGTGGVTK